MSNLEAQKKEILEGSGRIICETKHGNFPLSDCIQRQKNAQGWAKTKFHQNMRSWFFGKPGFDDPDCVDCQIGKKHMTEHESKTKKCANDIIKDTCVEFGFEQQALTNPDYSAKAIRPLREALAKRLHKKISNQEIAKIIGVSPGSIFTFINPPAKKKKSTHYPKPVITAEEKTALLKDLGEIEKADKTSLDIPPGFIPFSKCKRIYENPMVYCYGGRMIIFNSAACEKFGIKNCKSIKPFYSPKEKSLGFIFFKEPHNKDTYSLTHNKASSSFCSREFQARFQIENFERTLLEKSDEYENFYIAKLNEKTE